MNLTGSALPLKKDQVEIINSLLNKLRQHPQYNIAIKDAILSGLELSLNYHIHPDENQYCVSILSVKIDLLAMTSDQTNFTELAHIQGIGNEEGECFPLMTYMGKKIKRQYGLNKLPDIYLNGSLFMRDE